MSKSVSDQKVEDVLSSVRRLVSSELPRKPRPVVPEGPGALVLTPAHRVETNRMAKAKSHSLEERIAELEAAVGGQDEEFEPDGSEDQAQHRPDRIVYTRPPASSEEAAMRRSSVRLSQIALIETGPANEDGDIGNEAAPAPAAKGRDTPEFRREKEPRTPAPDEAPMAEDVPTAPRPTAEVRAFTDPDDVVRNIEARIASGRPISEPLPPVEPETTGKEPPAEEADDFDAALSKAVAASIASSTSDEEARAKADDDHKADVLAADEFDPSIFAADTLDPQVTAAEMLADPEDTVEVEESAAEPVVLTNPVAPDTEQTAKAPEPAPAPPEMPEADAAPTPAENVAETPEDTGAETPEPPSATGEAIAALAALPDDEAMRLLIARMIREELQGDLGERITRNVRKLVRREIKRALTSRDLA